MEESNIVTREIANGCLSFLCHSAINCNCNTLLLVKYLNPPFPEKKKKLRHLATLSATKAVVQNELMGVHIL